MADIWLPTMRPIYVYRDQATGRLLENQRPQRHFRRMLYADHRAANRASGPSSREPPDVSRRDSQAVKGQAIFQALATRRLPLRSHTRSAAGQWKASRAPPHVVYFGSEPFFSNRPAK